MIKLLIICQKVDKDDDVLGFFHGWVSHIAKHCETVTVIALAKGTIDLPQNVKVVSLRKEYGRNKVFQAILFYWYVLRFLPSVDGVFVHMAPEYVKALYPVNIFIKKPIILWYAHIRVSQTAKWAIDHVLYVLSPSKESFEYKPEKVVSTGHGIDTERFTLSDVVPQNESIMTISRISKEKRLEVIIKATHELVFKRSRTNVHLHIYGAPIRPDDKVYEKELRHLVATLNLQSYITWHGSIANVDTPRVYKLHSVFVRMQGGGGHGKTELEAMACGVPAITPTPVYAKNLGQFADDLYFLEDDTEALADRIISVLDWNNEKRREYSRLARSLVESKHNVKHVASEIVRLLEKKPS